MESIRKHYVVDEENNKIAVQIPIEDFKKIEKIMEDYGSGQRMKENVKDKLLKIQEAKGFYFTLDDAE